MAECIWIRHGYPYPDYNSQLLSQRSTTFHLINSFHSCWRADGVKAIDRRQTIVGVIALKCGRGKCRCFVNRLFELVITVNNLTWVNILTFTFAFHLHVGSLGYHSERKLQSNVAAAWDGGVVGE